VIGGIGASLAILLAAISHFSLSRRGSTDFFRYIIANFFFTALDNWIFANLGGFCFWFYFYYY